MATPILVTGEPFKVTYRNGKSAEVSVRALSIRELYTWARSFHEGGTPRLVSLLCGQPLEWVDTLSDDSFVALCAHPLMMDCFLRARAISEKDPEMAALIGPFVATGLLSMARMLIPTAQAVGATTSDSSPAPASSASAAESGSASST